nr:MAG: hypothetical protein [Eriocheir sinensis blumevirus 2]
MSMSDEQLFQWITGANLDLGTVWNFIPFSFLIDEFTNIGSVFTRLETSKTIRMTKYDHTIYTYKKTIPVTTKSGGISSLELVWYDRKVMRHAYYAYTHIINWGIPIINSIGMKITTSALLWRDR